MKQKKFGQTPLTVTPLGLGLAALGRPGYINLGHGGDLDHDYDVIEAMEANAHAVLDAAWEAGIRYFDVRSVIRPFRNLPRQLADQPPN